MTRSLPTSPWTYTVLLAGALLAGASAQAQTSPTPPSLAAQQERALLSASRFLASVADEYRPEQLTYLTWADDVWSNETRVTRTFDGNDLERETRYQWDEASGDWVESEYTVYTYFETGLISSSTHYEQTPTGPVPVDQVFYDYEGEVNSKLTTQVWDGSDWENDSQTEFTIANGRIEAWQDAEWDGAAWVPTERATLTEADGDVLQTHEVWDGAGWVNTDRTVYPDLTIAQLMEEFEELASTLTEYEGLLFGLSFPTSISQEWDGTDWINVSRTTREQFYDVWTGALARVVQTSEGWEAEAWVPETRFVNQYSVEEGTLGAPDTTRMQGFDGDDWFDILVETYEVEANSRRVVQATQAMDLGEGLQNVSRVQIDWKAFSTDVESGTDEAVFTLAPNAPNPFASGTTIAYELATPQAVLLVVYDGLGREVAVLQDGDQPAGSHRVHWEATGLPAGVYLYRLEAGGQSGTRRALLVR